MLLPEWVKLKLREDSFVKSYLKKNKITTVCETLRCPNRPYCYNVKTVSFMILGDRCTRRCGFCGSKKLKPYCPDPMEPQKVAKVVKDFSMKYVVITSPTRDDLADGGAEYYVETVKEVKRLSPETLIEVLVPDFGGNLEAVKRVISSEIVVFSHNLETVRRLYSSLRDANYERSLKILKEAKELRAEVITKSGIMLGVGETLDEVLNTLKDLKEVNCDIVTIGQYLQPSKNAYPVVKYINPEIFDRIAEFALKVGFKVVLSRPLVRSSTKAYEAYLAIKEGRYGRL
ncbi:MAG: lipoyl synthase [Thermodesulfovibrionaceae bacterium]